jgi:hypothetical protein
LATPCGQALKERLSQLWKWTPLDSSAAPSELGGFFCISWGSASLHPSPHRSEISENFDLKDYLIDSGSGSRIRPRGYRFWCFFGKRIFKQTVSIPLI